jgi:CheY-like chemotaxis protein
MDMPLKVLVIEDNTGDILLLRQHLLSVPEITFKIQTARSLEVGLQVLSDTVFDVILLDLSLPGSMGIETLVAIRNIVPKIPVIVITGYYRLYG